MKFDLAQVPSQAGRVIIVTDANSGIGYETSRMLAATGATVVIACRNARKASSGKSRIESNVPKAQLDVMALDLGDLASIGHFGQQFRERYDYLNVLINNAEQ